MGPLIFNIYVSDLQASLGQSSGLTCHQYADDTTLYVHCKPTNLKDGVSLLNASIKKLDKWSREANLVLNTTKTKGMLISTRQLRVAHSFDKADVDLNVNSNHIDCIDKTKLLGTFIDQHLKWDEHVKHLSASCYATLATLRKLKNILPFNIRKTVVQSLVLSKLFYNDCVLYPIPLGLVKRMEKVQKAAASFVFGRYVSMKDVIKLNWLPVKQQLEWHTLKITHKALHDPNWPKYLCVKRFNHERTLRSSAGTLLELPLISNTFQDQVASSFNKLPINLRNCEDHKQFVKDTFKFLLSQAKKDFV